MSANPDKVMRAIDWQMQELSPEDRLAFLKELQAFIFARVDDARAQLTPKEAA